MSQKNHRIVIIVAVLAIFASGCRSTQEYERLAKAGSAYSTAVDELLEARGNIRIDNTSEELLHLDRQRPPVSSEDYRELSINDQNQLVILERIQTHNQLLSRYFFLLGQVGNSKAPEDAQAAIGDIVTNLGIVSKQLQPLVENQEAVGSVTRLVVSGKIRGILRDELEKRKDTIQAELILQHELLDLLADQIEDNLKNIQKRREERLVIKPLIDDKPVTEQDAWVANRREVLTMETTVKELRAASDAADEFRGVFEDFVSGKLTVTRINIFLTDIQSFLGVIEALKK